MVWLLIQAIGITIVWVFGSLFEWIRDHGPKPWRTLANCPLCSGQWIGMIFFVLQDPLGPWDARRAISMVAFGAVTATCALLLSGVIDAVQELGGDD